MKAGAVSRHESPDGPVHHLGYRARCPRFHWRVALESSGIVTALMARCLAYWAGVSPLSDFFGLSKLYSRRQVSTTARA